MRAAAWPVMGALDCEPCELLCDMRVLRTWCATAPRARSKPREAVVGTTTTNAVVRADSTNGWNPSQSFEAPQPRRCMAGCVLAAAIDGA